MVLNIINKCANLPVTDDDSGGSGSGAKDGVKDD